MASFIQLLVSGLATGAIYALIAVGFTLLWQTSQTINFAQGEFVMLPAFFILASMNLGAPFWLACLIGIAAERLAPRSRRLKQGLSRSNLRFCTRSAHASAGSRVAHGCVSCWRWNNGAAARAISTGTTGMNRC